MTFVGYQLSGRLPGLYDEDECGMVPFIGGTLSMFP